MSPRGGGPGRGRGRRWITEVPPVHHFGPRGPGPRQTIVLSFAEVEALRLVDLEGMTQEEAAASMGVSRRTLWNDLKGARRKVALALTSGWAIRIEAIDYALRDE